MRAGVGIAAHHRHPRQRCALLRTNDVNNALTHVVHAKFSNPVFLAIVIQRLDLDTGNFILDALVTRCGGYVVIGHRQIGADSPWFAICQLQALECLGAGNFMQKLPVDIK